MNTVKQYVSLLKATKAKRRKVIKRLICLSVVVAASVVWNLRITGEGYSGTLYCKNEEHEHTLICYSNQEAYETSDEWEDEFKSYELTNNWANDLIAIADTQLGYRENTENFAVSRELNEEGNEEISGYYTRYGDWYRSKKGINAEYMDWTLSFVSFCLYYAGIEEEVVPYSVDINDWIEALQEKDLYSATIQEEAKPGDILLLNLDNDSQPDHAGIVKTAEKDEYKLIIGDLEGVVQEKAFVQTSAVIVGVVTLPENPDDPDKMEEENTAEEINADNSQSTPDSEEDSETSEDSQTQDISDETSEDDLQETDIDESSEDVSEEIDTDEATDSENEADTEEANTSEEEVDWYSLSDQQKAEYVISLIQALPPEDEVNEKLAILNEEDEDITDEQLDEASEYYLKLQEQVENCYKYYNKLTSLQLELISQEYIDKLESYSWLLTEEMAAYNSLEAKEKEKKTNKINTVETADTRGFMELNLYDYSTNINDLYHATDNNYPGFQQDYGTYIYDENKGAIQRNNFGNNITSDLLADASYTTNTSEINGKLNSVSRFKNMINTISYLLSASTPSYGAKHVMTPISIRTLQNFTSLGSGYHSAFQALLDEDGYPRLKPDSTQSSENDFSFSDEYNGSLKYLFSQNTYAEKVNKKESLTNLFTYDENTGFYSYDSLEHHAVNGKLN